MSVAHGVEEDKDSLRVHEELSEDGRDDNTILLEEVLHLGGGSRGTGRGINFLRFLVLALVVEISSGSAIRWKLFTTLCVWIHFPIFSRRNGSGCLFLFVFRF